MVLYYSFNFYFYNQLFSCSVMSNSLQPQGLWPARLLRPWEVLVLLLEVRSEPQRQETKLQDFGVLSNERTPDPTEH